MARAQISLAEYMQKRAARDSKEWRRLEDQVTRLRKELGAATATTMTQPTLAVTSVASSSRQDGKAFPEPDVTQDAVQAQDEQSGRQTMSQTRSTTSRSKSKEHADDEKQCSQSGTGSRATRNGAAKKAKT